MNNLLVQLDVLATTINFTVFVAGVVLAGVFCRILFDLYKGD